ncbi:CLAVATA3/ESR (CLE)-related protein 6 [Linum perenne]
MAATTPKGNMTTLVFIALFFSILICSSHARILRAQRHDDEVTGTSAAGVPHHEHASRSRSLLRELGFDDSKLMHYKRLSVAQKIASDRIAPGGPDPHHH